MIQFSRIEQNQSAYVSCNLNKIIIFAPDFDILAMNFVENISTI